MKLLDVRALKAILAVCLVGRSRGRAGCGGVGAFDGLGGLLLGRLCGGLSGRGSHVGGCVVGVSLGDSCRRAWSKDVSTAFGVGVQVPKSLGG